jgi:uncharacterized membrane protein (Fun14 family)
MPLLSSPFGLFDIGPSPVLPGARPTYAFAEAPLDQPVPHTPFDAGSLFDEALFLKLGFSFMVGLAIGFAIKIAFKIALLIGGLILLALFALQYLGLIDVRWSGIEIQYDGWVDWLSSHSGAFFDFIGDNLTSAAAFFAGLALGLKL